MGHTSDSIDALHKALGAGYSKDEQADMNTKRGFLDVLEKISRTAELSSEVKEACHRSWGWKTPIYGGALNVESLDAVLEYVTFDEKLIMLQKLKK